MYVTLARLNIRQLQRGKNVIEKRNNLFFGYSSSRVLEEFRVDSIKIPAAFPILTVGAVRVLSLRMLSKGLDLESVFVSGFRDSFSLYEHDPCLFAPWKL
jgi:hypothetical protein